MTMTRTRNKERTVPRTLEEYVKLPYRLEVTEGDYGSYVVRYPDLPGCVTQVERLEDVFPAAHEILAGWLEIALEDGQEIPLPRESDQYSGKFIVRITRSLHRQLAETAENEGVSLNAYVGQLLATGQSRTDIHRRFDDLCEKLDALHNRLPVSFSGVPRPSTSDTNLMGTNVPLAA